MPKLFKQNFYHKIIGVIFISFLCSCKGKIPLGNFDETKQRFKPSEKYFESNNPKQGLRIVDSILKKIKKPTLYDYAVYFNQHSYYSSWDSMYNKQINYADTLIELVNNNTSEEKGSLILINAYFDKAAGYYNLQNYEVANATYFKAYDLADKYGNTTSKSNLAYDIAMKMYQQKKFDISLQYFKYTYKYLLEDTITSLPHKNNKLQELLDNMGLCNYNLNKLDSALYYYNACINFINNTNNSLAIDAHNNFMRKQGALGVVHGNMAKVFVKQNNIDTAIVLYKKAIAYNSIPGADLRDMQICMIRLGAIYIAQKNTVALTQLIKDFKKTFKVFYTFNEVAELQKMQYHNYLLQQKPLLALKELQAYNVSKDSLLKIEASIIKQDIIKELKDREQQLQISVLSKNNKLNKLYIAIFIILSVIAFAIVYFVNRGYKKTKQNVQQLTLLNNAITQQKKEIEQVAIQLEVANTQKEKLMYVMAHELRSPISGIAAVANNLTQNQAINGQEKELVQMIEQTSANTLALINDLLSEKDNNQIILNKSMTNLQQLIHKTVALLQYKAKEKSQKIIVQDSNEHRLIYLDADKIERVLINLITNAIKFSLPQKQIHVETQWQENYVLIQVQDEGFGISNTQLQQLFDEQTIIKREGTMGEKSFGLGLAICKQIIESHQGSLMVQSQENEGSTFTVILPL